MSIQPPSPPLPAPVQNLLLGLGLLVALAGCAGSPRPDQARSGPVAGPGFASEAAPATPGPERVFATIDAAVRDAFETAAREGGPSDRDRLRFGTIRRVAGGFAWSEPIRSRGTVTETAPMRVRLPVGPDAVALYGLHPRSGQAELDRLNEGVTGHERRLVDQVDPLHRPLYVLTPSQRIVRYPDADAPEAVELVSRPAGGARR